MALSPVSAFFYLTYGKSSSSLAHNLDGQYYNYEAVSDVFPVEIVGITFEEAFLVESIKVAVDFDRSLQSTIQSGKNLSSW